MPTVVLWDYRDQPDWNEIDAALTRERVKRVSKVPDTGSDCFAVVVGVDTDDAAQAFFDAEAGSL